MFAITFFTNYVFLHIVLTKHNGVFNRNICVIISIKEFVFEIIFFTNIDYYCENIILNCMMQSVDNKSFQLITSPVF